MYFSTTKMELARNEKQKLEIDIPQDTNQTNLEINLVLYNGWKCYCALAYHYTHISKSITLSEYGIQKNIVHFAFTPMRCTKMTGN